MTVERRVSSQGFNPSPEGVESPRSGPFVGVAERPAQAPHVQLVGELREAGFQDQQWLVQRGDRFLQVTELLYRVLEQATGEQTIEEMAAALTASTEWIITAEQVRRILTTKLVPLGLIEAADGRQDAGSGVESLNRSPLSVTARMRVIPPRFIDPVASRLRYLFAPAILLPALVLVAASHARLYLDHDIRELSFGALYSPDLLLVLVGIVLLAAVFHEFGHAAALHYGGGQVRGMGVGFYLVYPVFYTDATDSYRLGRWARVRTDLGGIYFHLLFTLGLFVAYIVTRQDFLLLGVVAIDFQVISQFVPFIRLDGYWVLADLTGLPDPLSQIRPFLARMLGLPALSADKLPRLRSWVTWVFAVYIALTVPLLAFLLAMMLKGFPEYAAGTWAAFTYQIQILGILFAFRLYAEVAIVVINFFLLALPFVGTLYIFFGSAQWGLGILRRWSGPSPFRRAACTMGAIAVLATLGYVWTPGLTLIAEGAPAGVESFPAEHQAIVQTDVVYPQSPPAGGDHWSDWLNCGYYPTPVRNENAVDSLARGAVWVTYRPDLPPDQVASLRQLAHREGDLIVSPYPGLQAPIVASAWGRQLPLQSVTDPRLVQFVRAYQDGRQAPQPTPTCNGGVGHPD